VDYSKNFNMGLFYLKNISVIDLYCCCLQVKGNILIIFEYCAISQHIMMGNIRWRCNKSYVNL